jgi:integrase/recombinase XerD
MSATRGFPVLLEAFFVDRLLRQRQVSPHTIASYRDTFRLLLQYAQQQLGKAPSKLALSDLDTSFIGAFLDHLEQERNNSARSRNVRLAAIHSFFRYVALHAPEHSALAQRVLAMPSKRYVRGPIAFLNSVEVAALLAAPDLNSWGGRRDRALLLLAVQTGSAPLNLSAFAATTSYWVPRPTSDARVKAANSAIRRFAKIPSRCFALGCASARVSRTILSSQPSPVPR